MRKNIAKLIIAELFKAPRDFTELQHYTDTAYPQFAPVMEALEIHRIIGRGDENKYKIVAVKRAKKGLATEPLTIDEVYSMFTKRKNAARVFASYETHEGERGSEEEWKRVAGLLSKTGSQESLLKTLGLKDMPKTKAALSKAWKKAMLKAHPDKGGDTKQAQKINAAYQELLGRL